MKQAFIILGHKKPKQIKRLLNSLNAPFFAFFVHIDSRIDITPFENEFTNFNGEVHFVKDRKKGTWGDIGIVEATLSSLKEVLASHNQYTHVSLLSGQDYPIKSSKFIHTFFNENLNIDFIEFEPFPVPHIEGGGLERINSYSYNLFGKRYTYIPFKNTRKLNWKGYLVNTLLLLDQLVRKKRKTPNNFKNYYGSQWWSLSIQTLEEVMNYVELNPEYLRFHSSSLLPDEMFFQILLLNLKLEDLIINDNKRFILWNDQSSHPVLLTSDYFEEISTSKKLFARKFEPNEPILNLIDNIIKHE